MEMFDTSFWVQMIVYAVTFGVFYGKITTQIVQLERKVEQHNSMIERTYKLESDLRTAFSRIDEEKEDIKELKKCANNNNSNNSKE